MGVPRANRRAWTGFIGGRERAKPAGGYLGNERRRDQMPLFLLPYLYAQLALASMSSFWSVSLVTTAKD
jgi:hypothetical protein